jgi:mono/diheme cytochrome c family protein
MRRSRPRAHLLFGPLALLCAARAAAQAPPTFNRDIAPVFYSKCAGCHRPGEAAPMPLLTYEDARPWARSIRARVVNREMPPWFADPRFSHALVNDADGRTVLASAASSAGSFNLPAVVLPAAGTYTIAVDPAGTNVGTLDIAVTGNGR